MQVKLVVLKGGTKVRDIKLRLPTIVGRGRNCSLQLPHPLVSRQHCEIFEADGRLIVRDLASLNGTFLNDQKVTECEAPSGSKLTIGVVTFRIEYDESTARAESTTTDRMGAAAQMEAATAPASVGPPVDSPAPGVPSPSIAPMPMMPAAPMAAYAPAQPGVPMPAPMAVPLSGPMAGPVAAPMAFPSGAPSAAPLARPLSAGPAFVAPPHAATAPAAGPPGFPAGMPPRVDFTDFSETTQSAEENRAAMEAASQPTNATSPEEFTADEPGEDYVEVVEDAASLLPPLAIAPTPTLPNVPMINPAVAQLPPSAASVPPAAMAAGSAPPTPSSSSAANPAERPATADSEQDLLLFLKSLGK